MTTHGPVQSCSPGDPHPHSLHPHKLACSTPPDLFELVHYVAHTSISKRAVGLLLKGLLVNITDIQEICCAPEIMIRWKNYQAVPFPKKN